MDKGGLRHALRGAVASLAEGLMPAADGRNPRRANSPLVSRHVASYSTPYGGSVTIRVRLDAAEHALDVRRGRAVAAEQTMLPEGLQIARLRPGPREAWATTSRAQRTVWIKVACVTPHAAR
jgi:hypothetical protein